MTTDIRSHVETQLRWRYATKQFDATKKIPAQDWQVLESSLLLSPSSFGLQPWHFIVVQNQALRKELRAASWGQSQIEDASHLVVFCMNKHVTNDDVAAFIHRTAEVRGAEVSSLAGYQEVIKGFIARPDFDTKAWATRQTYIALGFFLETAAMLGIDACPMEGIDAAAYDKILGIEQSAYGAVVVATAGYRAETDKYADAPKVRFPKESVVEVRE